MLACLLTFAALFMAISWMSGEVVPRSYQMFHRRRKLLSACVHYYGFVCPWTLNVTVAIAMAYTKMVTLGIDPEHWNWAFTSGFFVLFFYVVLIVLVGLSFSLFQGGSSDLQFYKATILELYFVKMASYSAQVMFFVLIPLVVLLNVDSRTCDGGGDHRHLRERMPAHSVTQHKVDEPKIGRVVTDLGSGCATFNKTLRDLLGFTDYDIVVITAVSFFVIVPVLITMVSTYTKSYQYSRAAAGNTVYFVTLLTGSINLTYKFCPARTVAAVSFWLVIYSTVLLWSFAHIFMDRVHGKYYQHGRRGISTTLQGLKEMFNKCVCCTLLCTPPPDPSCQEPEELGALQQYQPALYQIE